MFRIDERNPLNAFKAAHLVLAFNLFKRLEFQAASVALAIAELNRTHRFCSVGATALTTFRTIHVLPPALHVARVPKGGEVGNKSHSVSGII